MGNQLSTKEYNPADDKLIGGAVVTQFIRIKANEGALVRGQVMAWDASTGTWVKYAVSGGDASTNIARAILNADITVGATELVAEAIISGEVISSGIVGIDYVVPDTEMTTPTVPVGVVVAGGSLAAATSHKYKVSALDSSGGKTATSPVLTIATVNATAGYATGAIVANIAAVNTILGDCSVTPKTVVFTVDGVTYSKSFALNYLAAGALASHAALITALDTATSTVTSSDGAAIKIASDSTGAASIVTIVSDTTGLFATPTLVAGIALSKTIKVTVASVAGATGYKIWRSVDGGNTYVQRDMTSAEIALGYIVDDGSLTYTAGTPVDTTNFAAVQQLFDRKIFIKELTEGYNFRGGY